MPYTVLSEGRVTLTALDAQGNDPETWNLACFHLFDFFVCVRTAEYFFYSIRHLEIIFKTRLSS